MTQNEIICKICDNTIIGTFYPKMYSFFSNTPVHYRGTIYPLLSSVGSFSSQSFQLSTKKYLLSLLL